MKCQNHPSAPAVDSCVRCETPLCGMCASFTPDGVFCESCLEIHETQKAVTAKSQRLERPEPSAAITEYDEDLLEKAKRRDDNGVKLQLAVIGICAVIMIVRLLFFGGPLGSGPDPNAQLSAEAQAQIQRITRMAECLAMLQEIGQTLAAGERPAAGVTCPNSLQPLVVRETADDIIVRVPQPELYGYADILVSRQDPNPRLVPLAAAQ